MPGLDRASGTEVLQADILGYGEVVDNYGLLVHEQYARVIRVGRVRMCLS